MSGDSVSSTFGSERLRRLHKQFLDSAEKYPCLRFLAVRPFDPVGEWPKVIAYPDGNTIGTPSHYWRQLFSILGYRSTDIFQPHDTVWLSIDNELWEGAIYNGGNTADPPELRKQYDDLLTAIADFYRLAERAANDFELSPEPVIGNDDFGGVLRPRLTHRWFEKLFALPLWESPDTQRFLDVKRLKSDVFTASARAVELLAAGSQQDRASDWRSLQSAARWRADDQRERADHTWRAMQDRDKLEAAWQSIYIPAPTAGIPVNYPRWGSNIMAFVDATALAGAVDDFLAVQPCSADEQNALSLLQAGWTGGADAVRRRMTELDALRDDGGWKRVFNDNSLFWRAIKPEPSNPLQPGPNNYTVPTQPANGISPQKKPKRSTERGEARLKLIGALTKHHKYADNGCLHLEPIGNNALAKQAGVAKRTASAFFTKQFGGHAKYRTICADASQLVVSLKLLNQEFSPHHLFGSVPPRERDADE